MKTRRAARFLVPAWIRAFVRHLLDGSLMSPHARVSFAQEGEDLLLARLFERQSTGFYVDIGAHHPARFSNTRLLHARGWRGINIDATPGSMVAFRRARPRDINLEIAVSSHRARHTLHLFDESALNSLSAGLSTHRDQTTDYAIAATIEIEALPLAEILDAHLPAAVHTIDLMTIDVEGYDLEVLRSNDWDRFRPAVLVIEVLASSLDDLSEREEVRFLRDQGYHLYAKLVHSVVLLDGSQTRV